ncbi:MAG: hypothetical protein LBQ14_04605 [Treponema sp.]|nr:hypothetical protein [Treponema sp.]
MRNRVSSVIALICILVYIAALGFAGWRMYTSIGERRNLANKEFNALADFASAANPSDFMNESFQGKLRAMLAGSKTLEGIIVSGPQNRETAFERVQGNAVVWSGNSPRFTARFGLNPNHFRSLPNGVRNAAVRGVSSYVEYNAFLDILKYTLFAVIAALSIAFFTLITELTLGRDNAAPEFRDSPRTPGRTGRRTGTSRRAEDPGEPPSESYDDEEPFGDFDGASGAPAPKAERPAERNQPWAKEESGVYADAGETDRSFEIPFEDIQAEALSGTDTFAGDEALSGTEDFAGDFAPAGFAGDEDLPGIDDFTGNEGAAQKMAGTEETREAAEHSPQGLYSPHGNIGWEAYTRERLEAELHRCASFDQDLVLISMEFKKDLDDPAYRQFTETAVQFFTIRDLLFEKGKRGITLIYPNIDLETGFAKSEEFHNRVLSTMSLSTPTDLCIGLSSRSGRLIEADRILMEASQALDRALQDPVSPIVAFKSDLEKYRAFIKNRQ